MITWRVSLLVAAAFALGAPAWAKHQVAQNQGPEQDQGGPQDQAGLPDQGGPQDQGAQQDQGSASAQPGAQGPQNDNPWYHQQLVELAQVLGGSHYLQTVCHGQGEQQWRDRMRALIQHAPQYSDELVEAFNRGYAVQQQRFADCDQGADQAATELRAQGLRISQALAAQHAN